MDNKKDMLFRIGLALQLLLIPVALLWRFSSEANYYNWVLVMAAAIVVALCFWPQAIVVRMKRLKAIRIQFVLVILLLALSWGGYAYLYHYIRTNCTPSYALHGGSGSASFTVQDLGKNCYFGPPTQNRSSSMTMYSINWEGLFGRNWVMALNAGISIRTAVALTVLFLMLPAINLYRYQLDKKRLRGIKKNELFV